MRSWLLLRIRLGNRYANERDAIDAVFEKYDTGWERFA